METMDQLQPLKPEVLPPIRICGAMEKQQQT